MPKHKRKASKKAGLPPGALIYTGSKKDEPVKISVIDYDAENLQEKEAKKIEECFPYKETQTVTWINIDGIHRVDIIEAVGNCYGIHPLVLEDVLNTEQRAKVEDFGDRLYVVMKMLSYKDNRVHSEQFNLILGQNFVISFQEEEGDVFESIRQRIREGRGRIRKKGADYLAYALMDAIVDSYFSILEKFGERIEALEEELVSNPSPQTLHEIHTLKRELLSLRKSVWPLREVISGLQRGESKLIKKETDKYLRDVYDHTIQVIDTIETYRDMVTGMLDIYLSSISNRMNEVMKVLTIIATIFIPITFIAGIYGMNFEYMPELAWRWAYFAVWAVILAVAFTMVVYFKRKGWL